MTRRRRRYFSARGYDLAARGAPSEEGEGGRRSSKGPDEGWRGRRCDGEVTNVRQGRGKRSG